MNLIEQIKVNDVSIDGYQGTYYSENPEWIKVILDSDEKVLAGIKADGTVEWSAGVPTPIREELLKKVDKEERKSLIDSDFADSQSSIDNLEYLAVTTDSEDKIIQGIKSDGTTIIGGDAIINGNVSIPSTEIKSEDNPEYIQVTTDEEDKIIMGIKSDGTVYIPIIENDSIDKKVDDAIKRIDASFGAVASYFSEIEDPEERSEIETDSEDKIISYRDADGVKYENIGIKTNILTAKKIVVGTISQSSDVEQTDKESIYLERPKFGEFWFYGQLPTDMSDERIPANLDFIFKVDDVVKLSAKCTLAILGHNSSGFPKKGYTFEPLNINGDALEIKFGNMISTDSFHLKAFMSEQTHSKDVCGYRVWERLIKALDYPYNKFNNIPLNISTEFNKNKNFIADAQYHPDGFPVAFYLNDVFHGLYTLRLKKTRQNYAMEKNEKSMIFLDAANYKEVIEGLTYYYSNMSIPFDYRGWELKNPKLKGYKDGGEIKDADVLASINRLFDFTSHLSEQWENYEDYIVLPHWLTFIILEELLISIDCCYNNINLLTWDNTHWSILPYDLDYSLGNKFGSLELHTPEECWGMTVTNGDIYPTFKQIFDTQIKELYTKFRRMGIIDTRALIDIYENQTKCIPRNVYSDDINKWGTPYSNGYVSIELIKAQIASRISYLDTIWLINN